MGLYRYILIDKPWYIFILKFGKQKNADKAITDNITYLHILEN